MRCSVERPLTDEELVANLESVVGLHSQFDVTAEDVEKALDQLPPSGMIIAQGPSKQLHVSEKMLALFAEAAKQGWLRQWSEGFSFGRELCLNKDPFRVAEEVEVFDE